MTHPFACILWAVLWLSTAATAQTNPYQHPQGEDPSSAGPPAPLRPDQLLRQGIDRLNHFVAATGSTSPEQIRGFLDREIAPYFDFRYMSRWAAGPHYRRLTESHRARFTEKLTELFLSALARNLGSYARPFPRIEVLPPRRGRTRNEVSVFARVVPLDGLTLKLEFRYYWSPDGWRIFDVTANGASAVAYYRRYFSGLIRQYGADELFGESG